MSNSLASAASDYGVTDRHALVTGGAGFIGSHVVDALVQANTVTVLDDLSSGKLDNVHPHAELVEGDICDSETVSDLMDDVDLVFHHAGLVSVEESIATPTRSHDVNVGGTIEILQAARRADVRVVVASSGAVYGRPSRVPIPETEIQEPLSPYGIDKMAIDHYARQFASLYGLPTVALRYFNVYGPRQSAANYSGVISTFLQQAEQGKPLTIHGDGTQTRDFVHVNDVVRANLLAATTDQTGEAFNVGTGTETSIEQLARTVCEVADTDGAIAYVDGRQGDIDRSCADIAKAKQLLEFEPSVELDAGLDTLLPDQQALKQD